MIVPGTMLGLIIAMKKTLDARLIAEMFQTTEPLEKTPPLLAETNFLPPFAGDARCDRLR
jgi:hypothetical protein